MNKSPIITIRQVPCRIEFGTYANGTPAMSAVEVETGETYAVLTVNYEERWEGLMNYRKAFKFPAVIIKNYGENEGVLKDLEDAKVVAIGGAYLSGSNGGVEARRLTPEWEAIGKEQLKAIKKSGRDGALTVR